MDLTNINEKLARLDSGKLIDIVKNYKQYGYPDIVREFALTLLAQQGITMEDLRLTGNLENTDYNRANDLFSTYKRFSFFAFMAYCVAILLKGLVIYRLVEPNNLVSIIFILSILIYLIFLLKSFLIQSDFFKLTGTEFGADGIWAYLFLGMPFYVIMYFIFQKQMKERMNLIS